LSFLPKDIVGDNYKIVAKIIASSHTKTAADSSNLNYVAHQRVDEGGPAVVIARNLLGIYIDDVNIVPKSNKKRTNTTTGIILTITPNPNTGIFNLNTNLPEQSNILIHNAMGQLVYEGKVMGAKTPIEFNNLQNGIYSLSVFDLSGKSKTTTFVVNK
jgi:Secretion system C-terminal sorting domain